MKAITILVVLLMVFGLLVMLPGVASAGPGLGPGQCAGGSLGEFFGRTEGIRPDVARDFFGKDFNATFGEFSFGPGAAWFCSPNDAWKHSPHD